MNILLGITVLFAYQLLGETLVSWLAIPLPGPVAGMLLLLATLVMHNKLATSLTNTANILLRNLSLFFVPAGVGVMLHFHRLEHEAIAITMALIISTVLTLVVTALIMKFALKLNQDNETKHG